MVCVAAISACKTAGVITYRDFKVDEAKKCKNVRTMLQETEIDMARVSYLTPPNCYDLHQYLGPAIPLDSGLHYFQELDNHLDCIRRGIVVRWSGLFHGLVLVWLDGTQFDHRCLGRHQACP